MPRGASPKREREYEELKRRFRRSGRYGNRAGEPVARKRARELAARIVNKQRAQHGETGAEKQKDREGKSPDRDLPIRNYQHLTISQMSSKVGSLSRADLRKVERYEKKHKNRKGALAAIEKARAAR